MASSHPGAGSAADDELRRPLLSTPPSPPHEVSVAKRREDDRAAVTTDDAPALPGNVEHTTNNTPETATKRNSSLLAHVQGWKGRTALFATVLVLGVVAVISTALALWGIRAPLRHQSPPARLPVPGRLAGVTYNSNTGCPGGGTGPAPQPTSVPEDVPGAPPAHGRAVVVVASRLPFNGAPVLEPPPFSKPSSQLQLLGVAAVKALRRTGCELPIEIWSEDADAAEIAAVVSALGDIANVSVHNGHVSRNARISAALRSSFREVLVIPATAMAVADPTPLFESPQYRATGTLLWAQDIEFDDGAATVNLTCRVPSVGVNMFLVDKARGSWDIDGVAVPNAAGRDTEHDTSLTVAALPPEAPWTALKLAASHQDYMPEVRPLKELLRSYLFTSTPFHLAAAYRNRSPEVCSAPITYGPAISSQGQNAFFVNVQLRSSDIFGEFYFEPMPPKCDLSIQSILETAERDSGIASKPMRIPTPGRLTSVPYNRNLGNADGDPSEPADDLRMITPGQPGGPSLFGRAVLITASEDNLVPLAVASARALRRTGSKLTVEIWARASSEALAKAATAVADLIDVSVHSLANATRNSITAAAAVQSAHREVLVISAFNFAMTDPEVVFETPEYLATGTLFWSRAPLPPSPSAPPRALAVDMLLVDKARADWSTKDEGDGNDSSSQSAVAALPPEAPWFALQSALAAPYGQMENALSVAYVRNRSPFNLVLLRPIPDCLRIELRRQPGPAKSVAAPLFVLLPFVRHHSGTASFPAYSSKCDPEIGKVYRKVEADMKYLAKVMFM